MVFLGRSVGVESEASGDKRCVHAEYSCRQYCRGNEDGCKHFVWSNGERRDFFIQPGTNYFLIVRHRIEFIYLVDDGLFVVSGPKCEAQDLNFGNPKIVRYLIPTFVATLTVVFPSAGYFALARVACRPLGTYESNWKPVNGQ